jgi:hypothetical protein
MPKMRSPVIELFYDVASPCKRNYNFLRVYDDCRAENVASIGALEPA